MSVVISKFSLSSTIIHVISYYIKCIDHLIFIWKVQVFEKSIDSVLLVSQWKDSQVFLVLHDVGTYALTDNNNRQGLMQ